MTTKPANAPSKSPSKLVVFFKIYSKINQPIAPALAEITVFVNASIAI